jgi:hypothetical protein
MSKIVIPLSAVVLALLAGCGTRQPDVVIVPQAAPVVTAPATASPPIVTSSAALRSGFGRIESMNAVATASAGGTAPGAMQRLGIRMEDGSLQIVDTSSPGFAIGNRVELTRDGYIRPHPQ